MQNKFKKISKYLSFILRHNPAAIGLTLDKNGWASIDELLEKTTDFVLTKDILKQVVETNDKQRYMINADFTLIRANQGHSIDVDLALEAKQPPKILFHGTAEQFIKSIEQEGLTKQRRHHVHLSQTIQVAEAVGKRHGKLVLLEIAAEKMAKTGFLFYKSANNVWLVDSVPYQYIRKL